MRLPGYRAQVPREAPQSAGAGIPLMSAKKTCVPRLPTARGTHVSLFSPGYRTDWRLRLLLRLPMNSSVPTISTTATGRAIYTRCTSPATM